MQIPKTQVSRPRWVLGSVVVMFLLTGLAAILVPRLWGSNRVITTLSRPSDDLLASVQDDYPLTPRSPSPLASPAPVVQKPVPSIPKAVATKPKPEPPNSTCIPLNYGAESPESKSFPCRPQLTSWEYTHQDVRLLIRIELSISRVGEPLTAYVEASHPTYSCCAYTLLWGDGEGHWENTSGACPDSHPEKLVFNASHAYQEARHWQFFVHATAVSEDVCDQGISGNTGAAGILGYLEITP